jgi:hypothetical protein
MVSVIHVEMLSENLGVGSVKDGCMRGGLKCSGAGAIGGGSSAGTVGGRSNQQNNFKMKIQFSVYDYS